MADGFALDSGNDSLDRVFAGGGVATKNVLSLLDVSMATSIGMNVVTADP